jgi:hypothetical protein
MGSSNAVYVCMCRTKSRHKSTVDTHTHSLSLSVFSLIVLVHLSYSLSRVHLSLSLFLSSPYLPTSLPPYLPPLPHTFQKTIELQKEIAAQVYTSIHGRSSSPLFQHISLHSPCTHDDGEYLRVYVCVCVCAHLHTYTHTAAQVLSAVYEHISLHLKLSEFFAILTNHYSTMPTPQSESTGDGSFDENCVEEEQ